MKKIIRKILREHKSDNYYKKLDIISMIVEIPYFQEMKEYKITDEDEQKYILRKIFGDDIIIDGKEIYNDNGTIYYEHSNGWYKNEFDDNGNILYYEDNNDIRVKYKYDDRGNMIYQEDSDGHWTKYEYDKYGHLEYQESSYGNIWDYR